jgi:hypothetical protein
LSGFGVASCPFWAPSPRPPPEVLFGSCRERLPQRPTGAPFPLFGLTWTAPAAGLIASPRPGPGALACAAFPPGPVWLLLGGSVVVVPPRACCFSLVSLGGALLPRCRWALPLSSPVALVCPGFGALRPRRFRCPSPWGTGFPAPRCGHRKPLRGSPSSSGTPPLWPCPPASDRLRLSRGVRAEPSRGMIWWGMHSVPFPPGALVADRPPLAKPHSSPDRGERTPLLCIS